MLICAMNFIRCLICLVLQKSSKWKIAPWSLTEQWKETLQGIVYKSDQVSDWHDSVVIALQIFYENFGFHEIAILT